jgi:serine/threonine protein kinase
MSVSKGAVIAGRYRAERRVGAGGMGEVWEGEHLALGSRVAIKTLLEGGEDNAELVARFRREAKLLGRMRSDHVARVVDFVEDPVVGLVLIMEYVEGRSLASVLEQKTLNIDEGLDLAIDLATALADLHQAKIVHRDIKPGNIIMQPVSVGSARAVLVDFGISRIEGRSEDDSLTGITRADMALGTVEYMAPEQILNSRQVTSASDVYAVGAILYRALSGRHVFGDRRDEALARAKLIDEPPSLSVGGSDPIAKELCAVVDRALK